MNAAEYDQSVAAQRTAAAQIYAPFDLTRFEALMADANPEALPR